MTTLPARSAAALVPVREALLEDARARAEQLRRDARDQADAVLAVARHDADAIHADAAADGERTARSDAALRSARVRRQAHDSVLAARNAIRLELYRQVTESASALRTDPRYPELMARLTARSRAGLGPDAVVSPSPHGGVVARSGSRHLDLSLPTLATQALESMAREVRTLWTP